MNNFFHPRPIRTVQLQGINLGLIDDIIKGVKEVKDAIGGKYAEGIHHRKIAAGINGLLGWGWTLDQIRSSPQLIAAIIRTGSWPQTISSVASGGAGTVRDAMAELGVKPDAPPSGSWNKLLFYNPPPDGTALDPILRSVFPGIPGYGGDLTKYFNELQSVQAQAQIQQSQGQQQTATAQQDAAGGNNTLLYAGLAAGGLLLIGGIVYVVSKKKN